MSSIFKPVGKLVRGVGKALGLVPDAPPPMPTQQPDSAAAKALVRQEERAKVAEKEALARLMSRKRARRTGGLRLLMSPQRIEDIEEKRKLGGNTPKSE